MQSTRRSATFCTTRASNKNVKFNHRALDRDRRLKHPSWSELAIDIEIDANMPDSDTEGEADEEEQKDDPMDVDDVDDIPPTADSAAAAATPVRSISTRDADVHAFLEEYITRHGLTLPLRMNGDAQNALLAETCQSMRW
jgi:hypothetical protein